MREELRLQFGDNKMKTHKPVYHYNLSFFRELNFI